MKKKVKLKILDQCFAHTFCSSWDNKSKYIEWNRDFDYQGDNDLVFFTDQNLFNFHKVRAKVKVGFLIEPSSTYPYSYSFVRENYMRDGFFDYILTFDKELIELNKNLEKDKFIYYAFGGSWIPEQDFKVYDKTKMVSIISSGKNQTSGHRLRHSCIQYLGKSMDVMGRGYREIDSKKEGLCEYQFSIIIENIRMDDYFSEKIIDPLSTSTIPIYWGTKNIGNYFDERGILIFDTVSELGYLLNSVISEEYYKSKLEYIKNNLELSKSYRVCEDWIWENWLKDKYEELTNK